MEEAAYSGAGLYSLDGGIWRAASVVVVVAPEPSHDGDAKDGRRLLIWPSASPIPVSVCAHALLGCVFFFYSSPKEDGQDLALHAAYYYYRCGQVSMFHPGYQRAVGTCLPPKKFCKIFQSLHHIVFCDTYIKY